MLSSCATAPKCIGAQCDAFYAKPAKMNYDILGMEYTQSRVELKLGVDEAKDKKIDHRLSLGLICVCN